MMSKRTKKNFEVVGTDKVPNTISAEEMKELAKVFKAHRATYSAADKTKIDLFAVGANMRAFLSAQDDTAPIEAGFFLDQCIKIVGISKAGFAEYIGMKSPNLSAILKGKRRINSFMATQLAQIFDIPALLWIAVENKNDLLRVKAEKATDLEKLSLEDLLLLA